MFLLIGILLGWVEIMPCGQPTSLVEYDDAIFVDFWCGCQDLFSFPMPMLFLSESSSGEPFDEEVNLSQTFIVQRLRFDSFVCDTPYGDDPCHCGMRRCDADRSTL